MTKQWFVVVLLCAAFAPGELNAVNLVSARSRRAHGGAGPFDIDLPLLGPMTVEPRQNGTAPRTILTFDSPIEPADGSLDCGQEVVITNGTCKSVSVNGNDLIINMMFNDNACVSVALFGIVGLAGPAEVHVATHQGDVNGDGSVDLRDLQTVKNQLNLGPLNVGNFKNDVTLNGSINILDLNAVKNNLFQALPPECSSPAPCPVAGVGAPSWSLTVNGSRDLYVSCDFVRPCPVVNLALSANLNTASNLVSGWQHALKTDRPDLWTFGSPAVQVLPFSGFATSDIVLGGPAAGSSITSGPEGEISVFAFTGGDRGWYDGSSPAEVFNLNSIGPLPYSVSTFWIGDSGRCNFMINAQHPEGIAFGSSAKFTVTNIPGLCEACVFLTAAASRRTHGASGTFDLPCRLTGTPTRDPRQAGTAPAMVLTFIAEVSPPDKCSDLLITNSTCSSVTTVQRDGYTDLIVALADVPKNTCVTLLVADTVFIVGDRDVSVMFQEGDVTGDGAVDSRDLQAIRSELHQPVTDANFKYDVTCNGKVNTLDLLAAKNNLGQSTACFVNLVAAQSRRVHRYQLFDFDLPLLGPAAVEPRQNGTAPQMILNFNSSITVTDGSVDCGQEVVVTNGTCKSVSIDRNELIIDMVFNDNACVTVSLSGIVDLVGVTEVHVATRQGDVNQDGSVDLRDLQAIKNAAKPFVAQATFSFDVNADGSIDTLDLLAAKQNLNQTAVCP